MKRRILSIFLAAGLVASVMAAAAPVGAQEVREVPADPNIVDDKQDSNYLTPQGGPSGGAYHTRADIWAAWFTADADTVSAHIQTELGGRSDNFPYFYRVRVDPGAGSTCLWFTGTLPVNADPGAPSGGLRNTCDGDETTEAEFLLDEGPDGTGVYTIKVPRSAHPALEAGGVLAAPFAEVTQFLGTSETGGATFPPIDSTETGRDYTVPGGEEEKAKKKETKKKVKGKGAKQKRKKGKKGRKKKAPVACEDFQPGELGAEADTIEITDAATEEEPVEQTVALDASLADFVIVQDPSRAYFNVQIDSKDPNVGLFVLFEFPTRRDYDIELLHPDGSYAARSHDFNPLQETPAGDQGNNEGHGGESTASTEKLVGIGTEDCGGWTVEAVNWLGEGGEFPIKMWLGPVENDPQAEGEEPRE